MDRRDLKPKCESTDEPDLALLTHIQSVGLSTVDEYVDWCMQHGFSRRTQKSAQQRLRERSYVRLAVANARLAQKKFEVKKPDRIIEQIFAGDVSEAQVTQPHLKALCRAREQAKESRHTRRALLELIRNVNGCSSLVSGQEVIPQYGRQAGNTYIDGLLALARKSHQWNRPLSEWKPQSHNARRQFSSLTRHLFCKWPVPAFMDAAWFLGDARQATTYQEWFVRVGAGQNIRTMDLPLHFTKRMAHCFMEAPPDATIEFALRWGQIHGLGGNASLAWAIAGTRLEGAFENDEFWTTVLRFFIANPMLDLAHVGPIIDYIHERRFVTHDVFVAPGVIERRGPAEPNFTMKGRTPDSLLRQAEAWHGSLAKRSQKPVDWLRSGIDSFEFFEGTEHGGNLKMWTITEMLSAKALIEEGRHMKHCVATYTHSCASGDRSIWSLEVETFEGRSKMLTLEVNNRTRVICQARGKCNATPGEKHRGILRRWAEQAGLSLAKYV